MDEQKLEYDTKLDIEWEGQPAEVLFKKPTFGGRNKVIKLATKTKMVGGEITKELDDVELKEQMIVASIVKAPFEVTLESIQNLSMKLGDKLLQETENLMTVSEDVKKN